MSKICEGDRVRSYDFQGREDCYVEGTVVRIGQWTECPCSQGHYEIEVDKRVWIGKEDPAVREEDSKVYPPVGGSRGNNDMVKKI